MRQPYTCTSPRKRPSKQCIMATAICIQGCFPRCAHCTSTHRVPYPGPVGLVSRCLDCVSCMGTRISCFCMCEREAVCDARDPFHLKPLTPTGRCVLWSTQVQNDYCPRQPAAHDHTINHILKWRKQMARRPAPDLSGPDCFSAASATPLPMSNRPTCGVG
jgi:hypothetical protein